MYFMNSSLPYRVGHIDNVRHRVEDTNGQKDSERGFAGGKKPKWHQKTEHYHAVDGIDGLFVSVGCSDVGRIVLIFAV